jgi:hypothetical protein
MYRDERAPSTSEYLRINEIDHDKTNDADEAGILLSRTLCKFPILMLWLYL